MRGGVYFCKILLFFMSGSRAGKIPHSSVNEVVDVDVDEGLPLHFCLLGDHCNYSVLQNHRVSSNQGECLIGLQLAGIKEARLAETSERQSKTIDQEDSMSLRSTHFEFTTICCAR
jgi:hypothetical protein